MVVRIINTEFICCTHPLPASGNVEDMQTLIGVGTGIVAAAAAGPAVAAIGLSVFFTRWIAKAYDNTCLSTSILFISSNPSTVQKPSVASWVTSST